MKGDLAGPFLSLSWFLPGQEWAVPEATGMWVTVAKVASTAEQRVSTGDFLGGSQSQEIATVLGQVSLWSLGRDVCSSTRKQRKYPSFCKVLYWRCPGAGQGYPNKVA